MCIIVYKPEGVAAPPTENLQQCFDKNDDGAGLAVWNRQKRRWHVTKGLMTWDTFKDHYESQELKPDDLWIAHFRIATAGLTDGGNTHPFPILDEYDKMREQQFHSTNILFHNGSVGAGHGDYSDTQRFIKEILFPTFKYEKRDARLKDVVKYILEESTSSKWIITRGKEVSQYGRWETDFNGVQFSNLTYKIYAPVTSTRPPWHRKSTSHTPVGGNPIRYTYTYRKDGWVDIKNSFGRVFRTFNSNNTTATQECERLYPPERRIFVEGYFDKADDQEKSDTSKDSKVEKKTNTQTEKPLRKFFQDDDDEPVDPCKAKFYSNNGLIHFENQLDNSVVAAICPLCYLSDTLGESNVYGADIYCTDCRTHFNKNTGEMVAFEEE